MLSYPDISECRNVFLSTWYEQGQGTHLLFVDADMRFKPELVLDMLAFDKPFIGTFYRKKADGVDWVGGVFPGQQEVVNGFMKAPYVGMGVSLISRECVDLLVEKYPELIFDIPEDDPLTLFGPYKLKRIFRFFDKIPKDYGMISEDIAFCKRYTDAGGEIYACVGHELGHVGVKDYSGRFWDVIQDSFQQAAE